MAMRPTRWLATALCAAAIGSAAGCHKPPAYETNSFYMGRTSEADSVSLGCANSGKAGRMTLFFGAPTTVNGVPGATVWGAPNIDVNQIGKSVTDFVRGYAYCRQDPSFRILIGIGTSNSAIDGRTDDWLYQHGQAWATMVRQVADVVNANWSWAAQIYAAWDAEPSWSQFTKANAWMGGYDSVPGRVALYYNGSADGCPTTVAGIAGPWGGPCNNAWNQNAVWYLSWAYDPALPFPQIYATSGVNAHQWQLIDLFATTVRGDGMFFFGTMSQSGACQQNGGCPGTDNTVHQAWDFMTSWLNSDARTQQGQIDGMTDVRWNT
jgi:hypothetical protein